MIKKIMVLGLAGMIFMLNGLSGCKISKKQEVEKSFNKVLDLYPTKKITDFYDMEGYRDESFKKDDKGTWFLHSSMSIREKEGFPIISEGMILWMNRNTNSAEGYYYIKETKVPDVNEKKYPVIYNNESFQLVDDISDNVLKEKIENFEFFVQYGQFDNLDKYKNIHQMYNPEVPMYSLEYQLDNNDENVKNLKKRYNIPMEKETTFLLKGRGDLEGSYLGYKNIRFTFDKDMPMFFTDSIAYQSSKEEEDKR